MESVKNKLMAVAVTVIKWDRLKRYVHPHLDACIEICMHVYYICTVLSRASAHGHSNLKHQKLGVGGYTEGCLNIPVQPPTPDPKFADRCY